MKTEIEKWLEETKSKNLSLEGILNEINTIMDKGALLQLEGNNNKDKAQILFDKWNKVEAEFNPKRGDKVLVWNNDENSATERIFVAEIKGSEYPIHVVYTGHGKKFINGVKFETARYKNMKPIPTIEEEPKDFKTKVFELIEKRIEICNEIIEENKNLNRLKNAVLWQDCKGECQEILTQIKELK